MLVRRQRQRRQGAMGLCVLAATAVGLAGCGGDAPRELSASEVSTTTSPLEASTSVPGTSSSSAPGGPTSTTASARSTRTTSTAGRPEGSVLTTTAPPQTTTPTTQKPRARPPGAPGPFFPSGDETQINESVNRWYRLLSTAVDSGACQPLLDDVQKSGFLTSPPPPAPSAAYAALYLGIAEGCLRRPTAAQNLNRARSLLQALQPLKPDDVSSSIDKTCQPEKLLVWAYETYLSQSITFGCTPRAG